MAERRSKRTTSDSPSVDSGSGPRIDAVIAELEQHVDALESGELPLEQALERFEAGVRLARVGAGILDALEQRVEMLLADSDDAVPFASASSHEAFTDDDEEA